MDYSESAKISKSERQTLLPKVRNCIWVRILNVLNLKYERLVHNSAKVVSLQVFGKFSVFPPYTPLGFCILV